MDLQPARSLPADRDDRLTTDPVTGLHNEHLFRLTLPREFSRAREGETNGALFAIKLDNIVAINALHGRQGGDEALRAVAYLLDNFRAASPARSSHLVFKLAGPVFGYYIPSCSAPEARALAEEILVQAGQSELYLDRLTVSIGIVNLYELFLEEGTAAEIALRIEQTVLYRLGIAERQGMNTICDSSETAEGAVAARPTVLVIEPEPLSIELLLRALEAAGFVVRTCTEGEGAVAFIQATPPNIIICEAMTPRLNGFVIRQRLRANALWNAIPFILVSHKKNEELIRKAVESDIRHFFRKPISITEVVGLVANLAKGGPR